MKKHDSRGVRYKDGMVHRVVRVVRTGATLRQYELACGRRIPTSFTSGKFPGIRTDVPVNCFACIAGASK